MTDWSIGDVAQAWIRFETAAKHRGENALTESPAMQDFWAAELVMEWTFKEPEKLWATIVEIWNRMDHDDMTLVGGLGAGPVEDLLCHHGYHYLPMIDEFCKVEPDFKTVLRMVWQSSMSPELWQKVQDVRGGPNL